MDKTKEFSELETILSEDVITAKAKTAAKNLLKKIGMNELISAEKDMIKNGKEWHANGKATNENEILRRLPEGHPLKEMVREHDELLSTLSLLEHVNLEISRQGLTKDLFGQLKILAQKLKDSEDHQRKEEEIFFPELEKRGIAGLTETMKAEHFGFREHRRELSELLQDPKGYFNFRSEIDRITKYLSYHMKEHIFKENNILYPAALGSIKDQSVWRKIKNQQ